MTNEIILLDSFGRKAEVSAKRSFEGAKHTRLTLDWHTSQTSIDSDLRWQLHALINRSRWFEQNNEYAEGFLKLLERNVVGPAGFALQMKIRDENGEHDRNAEGIIEQAWKRWGRKDHCDFSGSMSLIDHYKVCLRSMVRDGGHIIQKHRMIGPHGFQIEAKDIDFLDPNYNVQLKDGSRIVMSVEVDRGGRPIAYHLLGSHPGDIYFTGRGDKRTRVPAVNIIHPFLRKRSNQQRGYPEFATIMPNIRQLGGYKEATLVNARVSAAKMGFFTKTPGENASYGGDSAEQGGKYMDAEPGSMEELPMGLNFQAWDPKQPTTGYGDFIKESLRGEASALGISYISLANDPGDANFSSARVGLVDERESYKMLQQTMIEHVCEDIFSEWLFHALGSGVLSPLPTTKYEKFNHPVFRGRRWQWLDPKADSDAAKSDIEMGITSHASVAAERGNDEEEVLDEIEQTLSRRANAGLVGKDRLEGIRLASAMDEAEEGGKDEPLISSIGVGGVQALSMLIQSIGSGELSNEQAMTLLVSVFGFKEEDAKKIAGNKVDKVSET